MDKVEEHLADATAQGAKALLGGKRHALGKTYFELTVTGPCTPKVKIAQEETFGPVAALFPFATKQEAITLANDKGRSTVSTSTWRSSTSASPASSR